jgi:hypothetical protein
VIWILAFYLFDINRGSESGRDIRRVIWIVDIDIGIGIDIGIDIDIDIDIVDKDGSGV